MSEDVTARIAALESLIEELLVENQRLRGLLGLDQRDSGSHQVEATPTLFTDTESTVPAVTSSSSNAEKLDVFRSLFGTRTEVYATRWENATSGKSGWSPAVKDRWAKKRPTIDDCLVLTDEVFVKHLRGEATHGIYPLLRDDTCSLLACDFDKGSWALDSLAYLDACHKAGVPAALERSRSGNGAHVWIFFDAPVAAATARSFGASLLRTAMNARAELDLSSYDRFFPSQDFMPKGSFGNLIALPLHGESSKRGNTVFLDPTTMEPWPDQWEFLSSMRRLSADTVTALAESLRPVEAGPGISIVDLLRADGPAPPEVIHAKLAAMLSIERAGLPPALVAGLKHLASLHNPEYYERQRMRFSTWDTPQFTSATKKISTGCTFLEDSSRRRHRSSKKTTAALRSRISAPNTTNWTSSSAGRSARFRPRRSTS